MGVIVLATAVVHTAGVNWQSYGAIVGTVVTVMGLLLAWTSKRQSDLQRDIASAVSNLREVLLEKLETKEAVGQIKIDLAKANTRIDMIYQLQSIGGQLVTQLTPVRSDRPDH